MSATQKQRTGEAGVRLITLNDFPSPKERHLQLSSWITTVGSLPSDYGEGPSSSEAIHSARASWLPLIRHAQRSGGRGGPCLVRCPAKRRRPQYPPEWLQTTRSLEQLTCPHSPWPKCRAGERTAGSCVDAGPSQPQPRVAVPRLGSLTSLLSKSQ